MTAAETIPEQDRITLTDAAIDHVTREMAKVDGARGFRLGVAKTGCSGYGYLMDWVMEPGEDDLVFSQDGVDVYVDAKSFELIRGTRVDFIQEGLNRTFQFDNPNVTDECGCGESFAVR